MRVPSGESSLYREMIEPEQHHIIYYDFRKKLPEVNSTQKTAHAQKPRGTELSSQTMIAASPNPKSEKQFIWQPFPKIELPRDLPLPNLIARAKTALPPPPPAEVPKKPEPPPPAPRKAFVPPASPQAHAPAQPTMLEASPAALNALRSPSTPADTPAALKLGKKFLPPPPQAQPGRPAGTTLLDVPVGNLVSASRTVKAGLPEGLGTGPLASSMAPPPNAPLGTANSNGNANADIAIAGLHPTGELNGSLPEGARPGRFAKAPTLGEPSGAEGSGAGALTVPDLSIHDEKIPPTQPASINRKAILYAETVRNIPASTLSVPLRPSSRTIPAAVDARFQGRSVYTIVVPIENLPAYGGDWILWFAERNEKPGDAPSMHAPVPFRKLEPLHAMLAGNRAERWVQVSAVIKHDGTVDRISLLRSAPPAIEQAVIQDLQSWEFKPAMRDGTPVDVDVVVEIPFNLPVESASVGSK